MKATIKRALILTFLLSQLSIPDIQAQPHSGARLAGPRYGGTLTIGFDHAPTIINPILTDTSISAGIVSIVFDSLVEWGSDGRLIPRLAESWQVSEDGLTYTFFIRKGVLFHDSVELTSADVLYTYEKILDPEAHSPFRNNFRSVEKFAADEPYVFKVHLRERNAACIYEFVKPIAPKHLYQKEDLKTGGFNRNPIGTGAFRFEEWTSNDTIILSANPQYFAGKPYLDRLIYKAYPNRAEVWSAFMRGETDLMIFLSPEDYEITRLDPAFKTFTSAIPDYYLVLFNPNDPALSDKRIRLAIAHAVDLNRIVGKIEKGYGLVARGPLHPASPVFNKSVRPIEYDPVLALRMFAGAGWIKNKDGFLEKNSQRFIFRLLVDARNEKMLKLAKLLRQQLQEVGVAVDSRRYQSEEELQEIVATESIQGQLVMFIGLEPYAINMNVWHSKDRRQGKAWSVDGVRIGIDRILEMGDRAPNQEKKAEIYKMLHRRIYKSQPALFLYFPFSFNAVSSRIGGADEYLASPYMTDHLIKNFYIAENTN